MMCTCELSKQLSRNEESYSTIYGTNTFIFMRPVISQTLSKLMCSPTKSRPMMSSEDYGKKVHTLVCSKETIVVKKCFGISWL